MQPSESRDGQPRLDATQPEGMSRRQILRGGLVGLLVGVGLMALSTFFLVAPLEEPEQVLGVFLPLAVGLISAAFGLLALVPLFLGDTPQTARALAMALRGLAGLGTALASLGVVRGDVPWIAGVLAPLLVVVLLLKDAGRLASRAAGHTPRA